MKISFLHTLASNQALFAPYAEHLVASCLPITVVVKHHVHEQLLMDARQADSCPTKLDQVSANVHNTLTDIIQRDQPDMVLCSCSTIGGMAESFVATTTSGGCRVLRVDRPMAEQALQYSNIVVLAALESTIQPTLELLIQTAERKAAASRNDHVKNNHQDITTCVVPKAWDCFQKGDLPGYAQTIADYIMETYSNHNNNAKSKPVIVLAQASMSPAKNLVENRMKQPENVNNHITGIPRILTSPDICIQYLADQILSKARKE